jgi:hypothetical protein
MGTAGEPVKEVSEFATWLVYQLQVNLFAVGLHGLYTLHAAHR